MQTSASKLVLTNPPMTPIDATPHTGNSAPAPVVSQGRTNALPAYFALCAIFSFAILVARFRQTRVDAIASLYCIVLFAICVGPALMGRYNLRHRILAMFMGCYFVIFGLHPTIQAMTGHIAPIAWGSSETSTGVGAGYALTSDAVVIFGALALLAGYFLVSAMRGDKPSTFLNHEWRYGTVENIGAITWAIGFAEMIAYDLNVSPLHIPTHVMGLPLGIAANIRLLSPIGAIMLIYLVARGYRPQRVWTLLLIVMATEFLFGFVSNSKEVSFRIPVLLLVGLYYFGGRISKKLLITMLVVGVPYLLFFNAYRMITMEYGYTTPAEALAAFGENIEAVKRQTAGQAGVVSGGFENFTERVDGKIYVDIIVAGTDSGRVRRLDGESIGWFFESFIPRFLWAEKPDISIGQLFNHEFSLSESQFTFVPTTELGELYWNYGMPGAIIGMMVIGLIFAQLGGALLDQSAMTVSRFMMLLMSTYFLAVRFEGNIALQYSTFLRLVILIWVADRLLRLLGVSIAVPSAGGTASAAARTARPTNLFPR
jgi:hypothetical protein